MRPVTVAVTGGFGNQLFQFAAARALAGASGRDVRLCFRMFDAPAIRRVFVATRALLRRAFADADERFRLGALERNQDIVRVQTEASPTDRADDLHRGLSRTSLKRAFRDPAFRIPGMVILRQPEDVVAHLATDRADGTATPLVAGFMQGDRFVAPQLAGLREAIRTPAENDYRKRWIDRLAGRPTVGVHVRRGDYLKPAYARMFPIVPAWWFRRAAEVAMERIGTEARFAVFTDEPAWVRENIRLPGETILVSGEAAVTGLDDFAVLRSCAHHVISNSTFGWWAARLAAGGGTVVAPSRWLMGQPLPDDYLPRDWIALENPETRGEA
jgi:hypothetical protein